MEQRIQAAATSAGVDPAIINAIISAIMAFIAMCQPKPTPPKVLADAQAGNLRARYALHRAMRENGYHPLTPDGRKIEAALFDAAKSMTEDDAAELLGA